VKGEEPTVPLLTYTLYHVTSRQAADDILRNGFKGEKPIQLSNSPWKIGTKGDTAIKVMIALDGELVSGRPGDKHRFHVHLSAEILNNEATLSLVDPVERDRLRQEFGTPGDPKVE
jgi:hypothetical protein